MDEMQGIRHERNRLLSLCDWTQVQDAPLSEEQRTAWGVYRQALRDLPQQFATPEDVVFPDPPQS
jgi:hypothetical protein